MPTEADARIMVDCLLREAGWDIEERPQIWSEELTVFAPLSS